MARIEIDSITGTSPYNVYVSDIYANNKTFIGTISSSVPPTQFYYLPSIFNYAPAIMLTITDANNCEKFEIIECRIKKYLIVVSHIVIENKICVQEQ